VCSINNIHRHTLWTTLLIIIFSSLFFRLCSIYVISIVWSVYTSYLYRRITHYTIINTIRKTTDYTHHRKWYYNRIYDFDWIQQIDVRNNRTVRWRFHRKCLAIRVRELSSTLKSNTIVHMVSCLLRHLQTASLVVLQLLYYLYFLGLNAWHSPITMMVSVNYGNVSD